MSKEKQIEQTAREFCYLSAECENCQICDEKCHTDGELCFFKGMANEIIHHGYRKQEWISVEDRLPEESGEYLVFGRTFGNKKPKIWICECISIGSVMGWCNSAKNPIVEAWMPLPEPPKMKGGAE